MILKATPQNQYTKILGSSSLKNWQPQNYTTTDTIWKLPASRSCYFHSHFQNHTITTVTWTSIMDAPSMLSDVHKADDWKMGPLQKKKCLHNHVCEEKQPPRSHMEASHCWNLNTFILKAARVWRMWFLAHQSL